MQPPSSPRGRGPKQGQAPKPKPRRPAVVFQPKTYHQFQAGADLIIDAIRPTLGPVPRTVAIEQVVNRTKRPELLDDGAIIARRIIQIKHRGRDIGAMFVRHMLWELHETAGDGTATAAVLFQTLFNQGVRYVVDGGNAMRLRYHLEALTPMLLEKIEAQTIHLSGKENLASLAETICYDPPLAKVLGEIFDIIGEYGRLEIRSGSGRELERSYVEGIYWDGGLASRAMLEDLNTRRTSYENAAILITDLEIKEPQELVPVLDAALAAGLTRLVIVARTITDRALGMLLMKENRSKIQTIVVKTPGVEIYSQRNALEDLAILTGGKTVLQASGDTLAKVTADHFGHARRAWADYEFFGIVAGRGDPRVLRSHIATLRKSFANITDADERKRLQTRLGKLMGGAATLYIGDYTPMALEARKALADRTAEALRGAMREGVVPGGGVTLLSCRALLREKMKTAQEDEERAACRLLLKALEAPTRTLLDNAGFDPYEWMPEINKAGPGFGFDTIRRQLVDMNTAGVYDSTSVVKNALYSAIHSAALALTVDVFIHRKLPPESYATT
jgi:chaperonin GroEL